MPWPGCRFFLTNFSPFLCHNLLHCAHLSSPLSLYLSPMCASCCCCYCCCCVTHTHRYTHTCTWHAHNDSWLLASKSPRGVRVKYKQSEERMRERREETERRGGEGRQGAECGSRCCHLPPSGTFYSTRRPSCCDSLMKALIWVYQLKLRGKWKIHTNHMHNTKEMAPTDCSPFPPTQGQQQQKNPSIVV